MGEEHSSEVAVKELRLGLVCYGGVSLAIYMHGITKELHKLVVASNAYDADPSENRFDTGTTEHLYWTLLQAIERQTGVRWRVVIDIISGTSAGGINGIYLAKALAHDLRQDELRNLWMERGDIKKLLRGPAFIPAPIRAPFALLGSLRKRGQGKPPLRGDLMCRWLLDALRGMDPRDESGRTLVRGGGSLELFVTLTDFRGYPRHVPIRGLTIRDKRHRHVLAFTRDESMQLDQFGRAYDRMLAFGARGTSSFPGAFPPISLDDFDVFVGAGGDPEISREFFRIYELSGATSESTYFVDGGVLDNFPFAHAIDAIHRKPAGTQVVRRLAYIEPDPASHDRKDAVDAPGWLSTIWGSLSTIPATEPILDDLMRVRERNERVERVRDLIRLNESKVEETVTGFLGDTAPENPSLEEIDDWSGEAHRRAAALTGAGYAAYLEIKTMAVVRSFADTLNCVVNFPEESNEAVLVRRAAARWAREQKILGGESVSAQERIEFLKSFDLSYSARRLRFIVDGINQMYARIGSDVALRASLDEAKTVLYELRSPFTSALAGRTVPPELVAETVSVLGEMRISELAQADDGPALFMASKGAEFRQLKAGFEAFYNSTFEGSGSVLYNRFQEMTGEWDKDLRRRLVARYVGFPIWDALILPLVTVGDLGEIEPIQVIRFSPNEARKLSPQGARKLVGMGLHHFKAFFSRRGREKDYTWGRLDGVEHIIELLATEAGITDVDEGIYTAAFDAVLGEERDLAGARELKKELADKLAR